MKTDPIYEASGRNVTNWESESYPLTEAAREIKAATKAFEKMIGIPPLHEFDRAWREILHCLDRAWNKICVECKDRPNWMSLKKRYEHARRTDPLLRYVVQARNVSEHTISPIVKEWESNLRVASVSVGVSIEWDAWDRPLLPVTSRGIQYLPPESHKGIPMNEYRVSGVSEARTVAELAIRFYIEVLNEVLRDIFPSGK